MANLMNRTEFAKFAGVSGAAVTKACDRALKNAVDGAYIDAGHPDAIDYVDKIAAQRAEGPAPGIDPLYEATIAACAESGRWTVSFVKKNMRVGETRAKKILAQIDAAGVREKIQREDLIITTPAEKPAHVRGTAARKEAQIKSDTGDLEIFVPENIAKYAHMPLIEIIEKFGSAPRFKDWLAAFKDISAIEERQLKIEQTKGRLVSRDLVRSQVIAPFEAAHAQMLRDGSKTITARISAMVKAGDDQKAMNLKVEDILSSFIRPAKARITRALENAYISEDLDDV